MTVQAIYFMCQCAVPDAWQSLCL